MNDFISATTRICAVYGHPIKHSASPAMQNAGIAALGLNWRYVAFDVHPENLREAIAGAKAMRFIGLNLTVPHKLLAVGMVDLIDPSARGWRSINTVRFEGWTGNDWRPLALLPDDFEGKIRSVGFNTDADAVIRAVREDLGVTLKGARVLLLGAGGAGRAAAKRIVQEGPKKLWLVNRTTSRAKSLRESLMRYRSSPSLETLDNFTEEATHVVHQQIVSIGTDILGRSFVSVGYPNADIDLVINATSLGLKSTDQLPFDVSRFKLQQAKAVYDMIYRPAETPLLREAKRAGCRAANGLGMLLYQGAKALELWSGKSAPIEVMRQALHRHVYV